MSDQLAEIKRRLASRYMGRAGVHGFGLRQSEGAVCVYFAPLASQEQNDLLREIEREAAPARLIAIPEERARIT
jgi:hypothetical protein